MSNDSSRSLGIFDTALYDIQAAYGYSLNMSKAERLSTGDSRASHGAVITAVHLSKDGRPVRYKVDNSWSEDEGQKGWFVMSGEWFRQHALQLIVPGALVDQRWNDVFDGGEAVMLKPWDVVIG